MPRRPGLFRIVRNKFVTGLFILVPIAITAQALWWLFLFLDGFARPVAARLTEVEIPGLGVISEIPGLGIIAVVVVIFATGLLFSAGPLKRLLDGFDEVVEYIPLVGVVYGTVKKVFEGFGNLRSSNAFKRFVLAQLPGRTAPGFLTGTFTLRRADGESRSLCTVYIPTNHLYVGDVVVLPAHDVIETDLSIEDGISMILSAGAAIPASVGERNADREETD